LDSFSRYSRQGRCDDRPVPRDRTAAAAAVLRMKLDIRMPRFAICSAAFLAISTTAPALGEPSVGSVAAVKACTLTDRVSSSRRKWPEPAVCSKASTGRISRTRFLPRARSVLRPQLRGSSSRAARPPSRSPPTPGKPRSRHAAGGLHRGRDPFFSLRVVGREKSAFATYSRMTL
jgi:hypothetical protein